MDAEAGFRRLAEGAGGEVRLAEAALWIAADEYPGLEVAAWLDRLDGLGERAAARLHPAMTVDDAAAAVGAVLFGGEGLRGNTEDYYDPRNSFLNDVLERRLGIPITLSVIYMDVAARAGLTVQGVGLPGHFIVRAERGGARRLLDPFHGGTPLAGDDCEALLQRILGGGARLEPAHLRPVGTREIITRMLANLKGIYTARGDWTRALRTLDRLLLVCPEGLAERRDRGHVHVRLGNPRAAIRDWEAYLAGAPNAGDAGRVRHELRALRQALAVLN
jgi:regulator of sirC expression with transglutaminase-like and TPR domain